jgi:hypothetical protein
VSDEGEIELVGELDVVESAERVVVEYVDVVEYGTAGML